MKNTLPFFTALIVLTLAFFLSQPVETGAWPGSMTDEPYRTDRFETGGSGHLSVRTSGGSIRVTPSDDHTVTVKMYVRRSGRNLTQDETELRNFNITIEQRGREIIASAERTRSSMNILTGRDHQSVSFVVTVPRNFTTNLNTSGGSVHLDGVTGRQKVRTSGGSLNLLNITGELDASTSGGSVSLENVTGKVDASTSGGSISATRINGTISLRTSGGSIRLNDLSGKVDARTSGGSITATITQLDESLSLRTSGGSITVTLPSGKGMDLDLKGSRVDVNLDNFTGRAERDAVTGKMFGGGTPVELRTTGGTVRVRFE